MLRSFTVIIGFATILLIGCATGSYNINPVYTSAINEIRTSGVGQRFVLGEIRPHANGITATYELIGNDAKGGFVMVAPYGGQVRMGDGSIITFKGRVFLEGLTFRGDEKTPLVFAVFTRYGLVYLSGKGEVVLRDGRTVALP